MKNLYMIVMVALFIWGCQKEEVENKAPQLNGLTTSRLDTIKLAGDTAFRAFSFEVQDEGNLDITADIQVAEGLNWLYGKQTKESKWTTALTPNEVFSFSVGFHQVGRFDNSITLTDAAGAVSEYTLSFYVYENHPPVALLDIIPVGLLNEYEYRLSAGSSYDTDGQIVSYIFRINDFYAIETDQSEILYTFPNEGDYTVSLTVIDDEGSTKTAATIVKL